MILDQRRLGFIAAVLAAAAGILWVLQKDDHGILVALLFWFSIQLLLEVPALALQMSGERPRMVFLTAIGIPLVVFELLLCVSGAENRGFGGDLQGIEWILMAVIVVPVVLVGAVTAALACAWIRPAGRDA